MLSRCGINSSVKRGICRYSGISWVTYLKKWKEAGNKLILWTCRAGEALDNAISWCDDQGLIFDAINDNLPEIVEMYGNNSRKITCDYYIDDSALLPETVSA